MQSVTIAIPTYNRPHSLGAALRSASAQTYENLRIVVSDNASIGPKPRQIVERMAAEDPRIFYVRHNRNIGANANFLWLLDNADTDLFMWLGDDDRLEGPDYVSTLVSALGQSQMVFPEVNVEYADSTNAKLMSQHFGNCQTDRDYLLAWCRFGGGHPFYGLFRTDFLRSLSPSEALRPSWSYYNESLFLHRLFLAGGVRFCPDALLVYNGVNSSVKIPSREMLASFIKLSAETNLLFASAKLPLKERAEILRIIWGIYFPYTRFLFRKALRNETGG